MGKERRLGRGLEALLGQLPSRPEPTQPAPPDHPTETPPAAPHAETTPPPKPSQDGSVSPSAESLFRLDVPHGLPGQFGSQPHHPPAHVSHQISQNVENGRASAALPGSPRIDVHQIDRNPSQPRKEFNSEEMRSLSESISTHGLLQPVVVRQVEDRYQLVAGERRLRAAIEAGWADVPVNVIEADDRQTAELAIVENLQRKDLNPLEKAASFQQYLSQYGCTQEELAGRLKLDRSTIANFIRLLELPEAVQEAIRCGRITQGHARALLPLGDQREQIEFCGRIQREGLNVRQTESFVQEMIDAADHEPLGSDSPTGKTSRPAQAKSEHLAALEQEFRTALGMKVKISHNARGRGKLVVHFRDHDEFARLKKHVCGE